MTSEIVPTEDGGRTLRHPRLGETYHALQGAESEADCKFIRPARLAERLEQGPVRLLDIGFGLGVNCRAALACSAARPGTHPLHIDTLEREPEALERGLILVPEDPLCTDLQRCGTHSAANATVSLHPGDLRTLLPRLSGPYDVIFHDPFSPMKNTEAWTVEVFGLLKTLAAERALLATYSESRVVRRGLLEAGWRVGASKAIPPHRGGTLAALRIDDLDHPLDPTEFQTHPYRDPNLNASAKEIRSRREAALRACPTPDPA